MSRVIDDKYYCNSCHKLAYPPAVTDPCGHVFCDPCITTKSTCPKCNLKITISYDETAIMIREIQNLKIFSEELIPCVIKGCTQKISRKDMDTHLQEYHVNTLTTTIDSLQKKITELEKKVSNNNIGGKSADLYTESVHLSDKILKTNWENNEFITKHFMAFGEPFKFLIYPNRGGKKELGVFLRPTTIEPKFCFSIGIKYGTFTSSKTCTKDFSETEDSWGWSKFLEEKDNPYNKSNVKYITFHVELTLA